MNQIARRPMRVGVAGSVLAALVLALTGGGAHAQAPANAPANGSAGGNGAAQGATAGGPPGIEFGASEATGRRDGRDPMPAPDPGASAAAVPFQLVDDRDVDDRLPHPEDRYALAGGCYAIEVPGEGHIARDRAGLTLAGAEEAEPFHLQATRLGSYLVATNEGPDDRHEGAWWDRRGYLSAVSAVPDLPLLGTLPALPPLPVLDQLLPTDGLTRIAVAAEPSPDGDWVLGATGDDPDRRAPERAGDPPTYELTLPDRDRSIGVVDGVVTLVPAADAAPLVFHHLPDGEDGRPCATWPEVELGAEGRPAPTGQAPNSRVEGFFEAHVHGMAYEFIGGELRCGQPWHPYGVEYAIGDCFADGQVLNGILEVPLAGKPAQDPLTEYDPVGWPTFDYWPQHDTLTHEQFYHRWLERAYLGGLRLVTNLLVDNTALCQLYPLKRNSCNEMDGVRLQAQRLYELQDYLDAQAGGPGEGWLRIVTSPAQARETIHAGRLAVVLGIEVSVLFDCYEIVDQAQCTEEQIDERLQEVIDLGVRQMEIVNKFDNALTGVTGDEGVTGLVVNVGNRYITGHFWDMQSCDAVHDHDHEHAHLGDEHDKTQMNVVDEFPEQVPGEVDKLAARVLEVAGITRGYALPVYGPGPHCNTRGLTDLGAHLIRQMIRNGIIFDPDHMSATAQREAMDILEEEFIAAEEATRPGNRIGKGKRDGHGAGGRIHPGIISSHSWANEVTYQRIYQLDGLVAPRTANAASFADRWVQLRDYARQHAPPGYDFGMGYGADTNGLGAHPGPRTGEVATRVSYDEPWQAPIGGVMLEQQVTGLRAYDINTDGVAHYGLFADWFREVQLAAEERYPERGGGQAILRDMLAGAETYLATWERAAYGGNTCVVDGSRLQHEDLHALLGLNLEGFLRAIGQPVARDGDAFVYCAEGEDGEVDVVEVGFDAGGVAVEVRVGPPLSDLVSVDDGPGVVAAVLRGEGAAGHAVGGAPVGGPTDDGGTDALAGTVAGGGAGGVASGGDGHAHVHAHVHDGRGGLLASAAGTEGATGAGLGSLVLLLIGLVGLTVRRMVRPLR